MNKLRIFIIESPNPLDMLDQRSEQGTLEQICRLIGHDVASFNALSKANFRTICRYISSIESSEDRIRSDKTLVIHISAHGNEDGIGVGADFLKWDNLARNIARICNTEDDYKGKKVFVISACGATHHKITNTLEQLHKNNELSGLPIYIFTVADEEVIWEDAVVAWTIFYKEVAEIKLDNKKQVQRLLQRMKSGRFGNLKYHRWDDTKQKFRNYEPKE